jgi:PAS domain S-box-containing protein
MRRAALDRQKLASIVESSDDAIVGKDLDGVITSWNRGAERLFGYTAEEVIGRSIAIIIPAERMPEEDYVLQNIRAGHRVEPFETTRRRRDGTAIDVSVTVSAIVDRTGAIIGASKIARDIGERLRAERQREELIERERLSHDEAVAARDRLAFLADVGTVLTSSLDYQETLDRAVRLALPRLADYCSVVVQDEHGDLRHVAWGHVAREKEPILHELVTRALASADRLEFPTFGERVMKADQTLVADHATVGAEMAARAGSLPPDLSRLALQLQPYACVGVPLRVRGSVIGAMSFGTTEQESRREYRQVDVELIDEFARRVSLAIENARLFRHADELNRLKDEFLATLSHEMRTPLAAVLGWSRMLASGHLDQQRAAQAIDAIQRNAQAQSKIVDDLLDVARGMSGNLQLELTPIDLVTVAQRGIEAIAPAAAGKNIQVDMRAPEPVPITGDASRLQQVAWNLLSNAVKFTPPGGSVTIDIGAEDGVAELRVTDTGAGIPEKFLPYVFDKFRQADGSFARQHGGLGLGLAIARHLIELHGGSIEARSAGEGAGATFIVRLPRPAHSAESDVGTTAQ